MCSHFNKTILLEHLLSGFYFRLSAVSERVFRDVPAQQKSNFQAATIPQTNRITILIYMQNYISGD